MNADETRLMLAGLLSMYPNHRINEFAEGMWIQAMSDVPRDAAMQAAYEWVAEEAWFPTVAALKAKVQDAMSPLPTADQAWRMVMDRIRSTYPGRPAPDWDAPKIVQDALKDIGGLRAVRFSVKPAEVERRFRAVYGESRQREMRLTVLPGGMKEVSA